MRHSRNKPDDAALILAGGIAAALLGAAAASGWAWLYKEPFESNREHRHRATKVSAFAFGLAGALGAAAGALLLGPKTVGEKDWPHVLDRLTDQVGDLRKRLEKLT